MGAADIGDQADAGFGHGEQRAFGSDAVGAVDREAHAAAHGDAVDQRHPRLAATGDGLVHAIFVVEERLPQGPVLPALAAEKRNIAACAERPLAGAVDNDVLDLVVAHRIDDGAMDGHGHRVVERIERLRPVQRDPQRMATAFNQDFGCGFGHWRSTSLLGPSSSIGMADVVRRASKVPSSSNRSASMKAMRLPSLRQRPSA